jgi:uncharacterized protein
MWSAIERRMLFFPTSASDDWVQPQDAGLTAEDVSLTLNDGTAIHAWWCPGRDGMDAGRDGAILYCHGNAGNLSYRAYPILELQRFLRLPVFIFDYPGYGRSSGKPSEKGCYASADASYDWLVREKAARPERILLFGESLGGAVAVELALGRPHRALVLARTFTSIPDMARVQFPILPIGRFVRNRFDSLAKIDRCPGPTFIAHGDCDQLIPYRQSVRLFEKAKEPKRFFSMAGCDHNVPLPPSFYQALRDYLNECDERQRQSPAAAPSS